MKLRKLISSLRSALCFSSSTGPKDSSGNSSRHLSGGACEQHPYRPLFSLDLETRADALRRSVSPGSFSVPPLPDKYGHDPLSELGSYARSEIDRMTSLPFNNLLNRTGRMGKSYHEFIERQQQAVTKLHRHHLDALVYGLGVHSIDYRRMESEFYCREAERRKSVAASRVHARRFTQYMERQLNAAKIRTSSGWLVDPYY